MTHKKVHSNGSIPFSWEDKPGVRKALKPNNDYNSNNITVSSSSSLPSSEIPVIQGMIKIPLPPCASQPSLRSSTSGKTFRWQQDPFLMAYKECTKLDNTIDKKKGFILRKRMSIFSCKNSCDAKDGNFLKLPRLPIHKNPAFI